MLESESQLDHSQWIQSDNLEEGIGRLVARIGFVVHLVDFYEAIDDKRGIAIAGNTYNDADLFEWTAILFEK